MRIYTEVIFEWDDKQGKLVETSSESFDYQGEMALCKWDKLYYYDVQGNKYMHELEYTGKYKWTIKSVYSRVTNLTTGEVVAQRREDDMGKGDHRGWAQSVVKGQSSDNKYYASTKDAPATASSGWAEAYKSQYKFTPGTDHAANLKFANLYESDDFNMSQALTVFGEGGTVSEDYWTYDPFVDPETGETIDIGDYDGDIQDAYLYEGELRSLEDMEALVPGFDPLTWHQPEPNQPWTKKPAEVPIDIAAQESQGLIEASLSDWRAIVDPTVADEFQDELEDALMGIGWAEEDVMSAFKDLADPTTGEFTRIEEEYETDKAELIGEAVYDNEGNLISEGTFTEKMRTLLDTKTKGLEDIGVTREEELEALRETAGGAVREAEAKIGASGFAASGVGRTARDVLAEEIGKEARDIAAGITRERETVTGDYATDVARETGLKETALSAYETTRDQAALDAQDPWEAATTEYERVLLAHGAELGGAGDYTLESVTGGTEAKAEAALTGIQSDLMEMMRGVRLLPDVAEDWDPFSDPETLLGQPAPSGADWATTLGWSPVTKTFVTGMTSGLFRPTIEAFSYTPDVALQTYDPDTPYTLPWETEEDSGGGSGDPNKPGGGR